LPLWQQGLFVLRERCGRRIIWDSVSSLERANVNSGSNLDNGVGGGDSKKKREEYGRINGNCQKEGTQILRRTKMRLCRLGAGL